MATIAASNLATLSLRAGLTNKSFGPVLPSPVLGFPTPAKKGRVGCTLEKKPNESVNISSKLSMGASLMLAAASMIASSTGPAMALVDERLSTEGTGLPFGLSNNLLGWILFGVFGVIWSLYFVYASSLDEDDDSGLSL